MVVQPMHLFSPKEPDAPADWTVARNERSTSFTSERMLIRTETNISSLPVKLEDRHMSAVLGNSHRNSSGNHRIKNSTSLMMPWRYWALRLESEYENELKSSAPPH